MAQGQLVQVDHHRLRLTNLNKVLYPATGTTKGEVVDYASRIATVMLPHLARRPITRKRWVEGVGTPQEPREAFFVKELESGAPSWVARGTIQHSSAPKDYPIAVERATLVWLAQMASLELHVPQWQFAPDGAPLLPDRLVLDLDPGPGVGLPECAQVAAWARDILTDMGLPPVPVTSGSKGIHLYSWLPGEQTSDQVSAVARELARAMEADHPDLVVSTMSKSARPGKVFIDWSQNNGKKTTIAPYSLRGTPEPFVAAPRTWEELLEPRLRHLRFDEVLARVERVGDPLAPIANVGTDGGALQRYIDKRNAGSTPEPVPSSPQAPASDGGELSFVIQEHHATRLHFDLRLERNGVLVSWAVPKGVPRTSDVNHMAIQTEDHPLAYGSFEGTIPRGEYGGGEVTIWDSGTYELEKWRDDEILFTLVGKRQGRVRCVLIRTEGAGEKSMWLLRRTKNDAAGRPQPAADEDGSPVAGEDPTPVPEPARPARNKAPGLVERRAAEDHEPDPVDGPPARPEWLKPMLATMGNPARAHALARRAGRAWVELKWDGIRAIAMWAEGALTLRSRSGADITARYPELTGPGAAEVGAGTAVLDGEIVALDPQGRPDFGLLQRRMNLVNASEIAREARRTPVRLYLFDALQVDGQALVDRPLSERREMLERVAMRAGESVMVPPVFDHIDATLAAAEEHNLEGIIVKDPRSIYRAGQRSEEWLKVKITRTADVVIGGIRRKEGARGATFSSLLLGIPQDGSTADVGHSDHQEGFPGNALPETGTSVSNPPSGESSPPGTRPLRYVGRVGSGFSDRVLRELTESLVPLVTTQSPFIDVPGIDARDAIWVQPVLWARVEYAERTASGALRHARWRGLLNQADTPPVG